MAHVVVQIGVRDGEARDVTHVSTPPDADGHQDGTSAAGGPGRCDNPEHLSALRRDAVTFSQIFGAKRIVIQHERDNASDVGLRRRCYLELRESYQKRAGRILAEYYSDDYSKGVLATDLGELEIMGSGLHHEVSTRLARCEKLAGEATRLLRGDDRRVCALKFYSAAAHLLAYDAPTEEGKTPDEIIADRDRVKQDLAYVDELLDQAQLYYLRAARLSAELDYTRGVLVGTVLMWGIGWIGNWMLNTWRIDSLDVMPITTLFVTGGIGAMVSVMSRLHNGNLTLNYEAGRRHIIALGVIRPLIGGLFALVILFLLRSQMVTTIKPVDNIPIIYFNAVIGFFAGFSERFVQDMLSRGPGGDQYGGTARTTPDRDTPVERT